MEQESFSSSRRRAAASEVHHLARLPAGGCRRPGLRPRASLSPRSKAGGERKKRFNCRAQREQTRFSGGARSHAAGGDAVLHPSRARGATAGLARRGARGPRRRRRGRWEMSVPQEEEEGGEAELNRARGR